ncbi:MAG TPA: single-stranded-DNA-specific exonuclease RecJ [Nitrospiria bacterium]|nr:single-stranded-DNA-specific exonuclease RecJ [Nitrospiria bacterium]
MRKRWEQRPYNPDVVAALVQGLGVRRTTARILASRKVDSVEAARRFLAPSAADLHDPFLLTGMDRAVERIERAVAGRERILIAGDYDVDGVTATSLYLELFAWLGTPVAYRIPHRLTEGYGLTETGVRAARDQGVSLLITADCGTTAHGPIELANSFGIDVIVTDHHEPQDRIPPAYALLNPHLPDSRYPEKVLCAAGIAFKVAQALLGRRRSLPGVDGRLASVLDLVALGTVADVAPLRGENRYLVAEGLRALSAGRRVGVAALKTVCGMEGKRVDAGMVGFQLGPRINAVGRLAAAHSGVTLLTTTDPQVAITAARELDAANQERRRIEEAMLEGAVAKAERELSMDRARSIVLADEAWHPGVIGIIASRLVDRWHRPAIVIALRPDGKGKGSGRSIPGFHLTRALEECREFFEGFGGHAAAAGLTIRTERIPTFRERFDAVVAATLSTDSAQPILSLDDEVELVDVTFPLIDELSRLAPFGMGNPEPLLTSRGCAPRGARIVGNNHLKLLVRHANAASLDAIGFGLGHLLPTDPGPIDLAYSARVDSWQGQDRIQLRLKDLRPSQSGS